MVQSNLLLNRYIASERKFIYTASVFPRTSFSSHRAMESDEQNILVDNVDAQGQANGNGWRKFKLEPALVVIFFGMNLSSSIIANQLLRNTCLTFGYNATDCDNLGGNKTKAIEDKIQPHVAEIIMTMTLLNSIIPAILSLFLGPWTDRFGRKKVICSTFIGYSLTYGLLTVVSFLSEQLPMIDPWIYVLPSIPAILSGGWPSMIVAVLCYITDLTDESKRSTRLTIIELLIFVGVLFGTASSSYILNLTSPTTVFIISTTCLTLATIYTIVFVDESVQDVAIASPCDQLKELFSPAPVKEMMQTCFKRRSFKERRILWCLITILMFTVFTMNGTGNVFYLFVREKFMWTLKEATRFDSITMLITIVGSFLGIGIFKRLLKFSDLSIAIMAVLSMLLDSFIRAFADTPSQMYAASGICLFRVLASPMCRSLISQIIPSHEIGKVFSITSSFEAVSSLIASPLYTFIYSKTFTFFAGAFYLITAGVYVINLILVYCVLRMTKTRDSLMNPYTTIENT